MEKGVAYLTPRRLLFCWWPGVITRLLFAFLSVLRCLELRGSLQCGAGQHLKDGASGNDNQ